MRLASERRHDVVLVVVGEREEHVHLVDVLLVEQLLVGGVALQHQGALDARRATRRGAVRFDDLDLVFFSMARASAKADVAAAGDHDPLDGLSMRRSSRITLRMCRWRQGRRPRRRLDDGVARSG
jgi:hypothetical protein